MKREKHFDEVKNCQNNQIGLVVVLIGGPNSYQISISISVLTRTSGQSQKETYIRNKTTVQWRAVRPLKGSVYMGQLEN